jgi:hypothetical protein|tara:strand:- start:569 stop:775 length:207 start_codon:yes stop_codon:yes gene_type:complete
MMLFTAAGFLAAAFLFGFAAGVVWSVSRHKQQQLERDRIAAAFFRALSRTTAEVVRDIQEAARNHQWN